MVMARTTCTLVLMLLGAVRAADVCVPEFGKEARAVVIAKSGDGLATPRDLQFHPASGELWVASADAGGSQSGNYIIRNPGTPEQTSMLLQDKISFHYEDNLAAFVFDKQGKVLMTCQESENRYLGLAAGPNWFQGPTAFELYPCDGGYGRLNEDGSCTVLTVDQEGEECTGEACYIIHSDMLHEAPLCMGMAHDPGAVTGTSGFNVIEERTPGHVVWHHDGMRGKLMRFDFDSLHGTETIDHRYANIRRYVDVDIKRRPGVPGHMVVDDEARVLYVADTGNKRVLRVAADSGRFLRGAQCVPDECYPTNTNHTCAESGRMFSSRAACEAGGCGACSRDLTAKYGCFAGHCTEGVCAGEDGFGCYTIYTETGDMFEYELWGCTEYSVFSTEVGAPSGIALDGRGRVFVSDYDSGLIYALDQAGAVLSTHLVGKGVAGLEISCPQVGECTLWFVNIDTKEVSKLQVEEPCVPATAAASALPSVPAVEGMPTGYEAHTCARGEADRTRPNFILRHGEGYNNRMIVHHAYGKACAGVEMGTVPVDMEEEAKQAACPDRTDCSALNYDLLVMAGFFCHPCLQDPCEHGGKCSNIVRKGYTCDCAGTGHSGERCEVPEDAGALCAALGAPGQGALVPASGCSAGSARPGQACLLHCPATMQPLRPPAAPADADLLATCGADGKWAGGGMACGCADGRFGRGCGLRLEAAAAAEGEVSAAGGGAVAVPSGEGVAVPPNALPDTVQVRVAVYDVEGLEVAGEGGALEPAVSGGQAGALRSHVTELRPHGLRFSSPATLTLTHANAKDAGRLGVFFWDEGTEAWSEVAGARVEGASISAPISHFSRWAVLEKPPPALAAADDDDSGGLSVGAWVGVGVGCFAGVALVGAVGYYVSTQQQPAAAASKAASGSSASSAAAGADKASPPQPAAPQQPAVVSGSNFPSAPLPHQQA